MMAFDLTTHLIDTCRERFLKDRNPLHAWRAYQLVRQRGIPVLQDDGTLGLMDGQPLPLPDWLAEYLDACAEVLLAGAKAEDALKLAKDKKPGKRGSGGPSKHRQLLTRSRDAALVGHIDMMLTLDDAELDAMCGPRKRGESRLSQVCTFMAEVTKDRRNWFGVELPLSPATIENIYEASKTK